MRIQSVVPPPSNFWTSLPFLTVFKRGVDASEITLLLICFSLSKQEKFITLTKRRETQPSTTEEGKRGGMFLSVPINPWLAGRSAGPSLTQPEHKGYKNYEPWWFLSQFSSVHALGFNAKAFTSSKPKFTAGATQGLVTGWRMVPGRGKVWIKIPGDSS